MHDLLPQGSLEDVFPPRLIAGLHVREFEGMLRLALPDAIKVLYFRKGEIASAASNAEPDRLANILTAEGRLNAQQLELAQSRMQSGASLGKALIEMGFLTPSELLQGARQQVKVIVSSCFAAGTGDYEMIPGPLPPEVTSLGLNTRRLLFDALLNFGDRASVIREVGSMESVYRPTDRLDTVLASLRLDVESHRIGRNLDGNASLREISGRTSHDDLTVSKVVLALDLLGAAESLSPGEGHAPETDSGSEIPIISDVQAEDVQPETEATDSVEIEIEAPGSESSEQDSAAQPFAEPEPAPSAPVEIAEPHAEEFDHSAPPAATVPGEGIDQVAFPAALTEPLADEPMAAEPPPIPQEELPAFAQTAAEPSAEPQAVSGPDGGPNWQIDPETGERVHEGPIEMTFDGRIAQGTGESRNLMWFLVVAGAITLVVGGSLGYVFLRRGAGAPEERTAARSANPPVGRPDSAVAPPSEGAVAAVPDRPARIEAAPPTAQPPEKPAQEARAAASETAPAAAPEAAPAARPSLPTGTKAEGPTVTPEFDAGLRRLDQGDAAGAARQFEEWIASQDPRRFALQIMIACQEETVKGARAHAPGSSSLFILPYALGGRSCYRVCWGVYDDAEAARAAIPSIPSALTGQSVPPIVPLSRLRRAG